jgi:hypothetical protein
LAQPKGCGYQSLNLGFCNGGSGIEEGNRYTVMRYGDAMSPKALPPEDFVSLYRLAFRDYGVRALWSMRPVDDPTPADALAITNCIR